jgi:hypothetical protein
MESIERYGVCVENRGHAAALEVRKLYRLVEDPLAAARGLIRVIDESGEDYLYPEAYFELIEVPRRVVEAFSRKSA